MAGGTLYRHFPSRVKLIEAVLADQISELVELGRQLLTTEDESDESDALATLLRFALLHALTYRGPAAAVIKSALDSGNGPAATWHAQLFETGALLERARRAGAVVPLLRTSVC